MISKTFRNSLWNYSVNPSRLKELTRLTHRKQQLTPMTGTFPDLRFITRTKVNTASSARRR